MAVGLAEALLRFLFIEVLRKLLSEVHFRLDVGRRLSGELTFFVLLQLKIAVPVDEVSRSRGVLLPLCRCLVRLAQWNKRLGSRLLLLLVLEYILASKIISLLRRLVRVIFVGLLAIVVRDLSSCFRSLVPAVSASAIEWTLGPVFLLASP